MMSDVDSKVKRRHTVLNSDWQQPPLVWMDWWSMLVPSVSWENREKDRLEQSGNKVMRRDSDRRNDLDENENECHRRRWRVWSSQAHLLYYSQAQCAMAAFDRLRPSSICIVSTILVSHKYLDHRVISSFLRRAIESLTIAFHSSLVIIIDVSFDRFGISRNRIDPTADLADLDPYFRVAWPLFSRKPLANWKRKRDECCRSDECLCQLTGLLSIFKRVT